VAEFGRARLSTRLIRTHSTSSKTLIWSSLSRTVIEEKISSPGEGVDARSGRATFTASSEFRDDGMFELLQDTPHVFRYVAA